MVRWGFALDAGLALFIGIPALMLALLLFYFMLFFGFFAFVAEMPM
ncbi:hypothetical protein ACFST9_17720 [Hymenobacter monticola]|uniref:Uncharacterized protein n=1 Tax=Hymenobacter monticola TaxID=1705399 RepID=A0ABY4AZC5_9BACT|nr:hypothetical protein [Hymenobacter monticola]UOE32255.1 hypothetical protein MTP16_14060 [Hymenobacter monticola]